MSNNARKHFFDSMHPAVLLAYFLVILAFSMLAFHPVFISLSCIGAILLSVFLRGWISTGKTLVWQLPLVVLIAIINPVFSSMGTTELFSIGDKVVHSEELIFGGCMGLMLITVMLWFANLSEVLGADKLRSLCGNKAPTLGFMLSAVMRQIPQLLKRGRAIDYSMRACTSSSSLANAKPLSSRVRLGSVLMAWSMENSLEMADAMKARGWNSTDSRSSYQRRSFRRRDVLGLVALFGLTIACLGLSLSELTSFHFYPIMTQLQFQLAYLVYALLVLLPVVSALVEYVRWR
ncbi:MAG: energy-coupling factor transporter transmembrane component T [Raoultibacter sp.]